MSIAVPLTTVYANTRNGTATYSQSDGTIATQSELLTRTDHWINGQRGRLFEPSRTNSIRNSVLAGSTNGVMGSGGAAPTNMVIGAPTPLPVEVTGSGVEDGYNYIELDFSGTGSGTQAFFFEQVTQIVAATGQTWSGSVFAKLISGSLSNIAFNLAIDERTSGGGLVSRNTGPSLNLTNRIDRTTYSPTLSGGATVERVVPLILYTTSGAVSCRIRVYSPQMEQGAFATTFIPTSTVAVTRLADRASCSLSDIGFDAAGGSIFIEGRAYYNASGSGFPRIFQIDDGTANNTIQLYITEAGNQLGFAVTLGGVSQANEIVSYTSGDYFKVGIRYKEDNCVLSLNGSDTTADTSATIPSGLTTLNWQTSQIGANNGAAVHITKFETYAKEFADATLNTETA